MTPKNLKDFVREARSHIQEISAAELEQRLAGEPELLVVDVREINEYRAGHIPGALLVPRGILEGAADPDYPHRIEALCQARTRPVVLYCKTGGRSALATYTLTQMGFAQVASLMGGFELWESDDRPVETGDSPRQSA
ncbi:MAG TPA: rhodanese-like domain-containing protein [Acidiferrobacteraceae bacterium]|nr:rhodanese-like domain-containing protein [Acidiferrobacteraceae bacterium]